MTTRALVTGATGFIGYHLVKHLSRSGTDVSCLVRPSSDCSRLKNFRPRLVPGDIADRDSVRKAIADVDVIYHLAGATKSLSSKKLDQVNEGGTRNIAATAAERVQPPVLVYVSSLAAAGPSLGGRARTESDAVSPVSAYGRSKRAGELAAGEYAAIVPTTIVRPPIVLGEGDRDGLNLFQGIAKLGIHLVPSFANYKFSTIHAEDLAIALTLSASEGKRLAAKDSADGIYFAAANETLTYAHLGRLIGDVLGRRRISVLHCPSLAVWLVAAINEIVSQLRRRPHILGLDKAREATAGSWTCTSASLYRDTGFAPAKTLRQRLEQTAQWYVEQGWLTKPKHATPARRPEPQQRLET